MAARKGAAGAVPIGVRRHWEASTVDDEAPAVFAEFGSGYWIASARWSSKAGRLAHGLARSARRSFEFGSPMAWSGEGAGGVTNDVRARPRCLIGERARLSGSPGRRTAR